VSFIREINHSHLRLNLDFGALITNNEDLEDYYKYADIIQHIHLSEPFLRPLEKRNIHKKLKTLNCDKYISIEMSNINDFKVIKETILYVIDIYQ